jgi:clan AA aspartic protease
MITGTVNARHEIVIRIAVRNAAGTEQEVEAILDTGFNGSLTLPPALIVSLGLTWVTRGSAILADGRTEQFDVYAADVIWDGVARHLLIPAIGTSSLLGMELLIGYELRAQVTSGGLVQIEAIP